MVPEQILSFWIDFYSVCSKLVSCLSLLPTLWSNLILPNCMYLAPGFLPWTLAIWMVSRGLETRFSDCELMHLPVPGSRSVLWPSLSLWIPGWGAFHIEKKLENDTSWPLSVWWPSGSSPLVSNVPREGSRHSDLVYTLKFSISFEKSPWTVLTKPTKTYGQISFPNFSSAWFQFSFHY